MVKEPLSPWRLAAFVSPEAPFNAFLMAILIFVPPFYAGSMGLGLSTVGLVFGLTKLWDVITDPIFGALSDRIQTRWGRRKPWLITAVPILCLCTYMTFIPGDEVGVTYFAVWMVLLYVGWTIGSVSHIAWAAELSTEYHERSRISAYKQAAALLGTLGLFLTIAIFDQALSGDERARMELIANTLLFVFPICVFLATRSVGEEKEWTTCDGSSMANNQTIRPPLIRNEKPNSSTVATLFANKPLRLLLTANLLIGISGGGTAGMLLFYVENVLELGRWSAFAMVPILFSGLLFLPICLILARRYGKHKALCYALIYQLFASTLYLVLPAGNLPLAIVAFAVLGASSAVGTFIPRSMMADVADIEIAESGEQKTGLYMSLLQTSSKLSAALAIGLSYPVLGLIGFDPSPDAVNTQESLNGLRLLMIAFPGVGFLIIIALMWRFPLDEATQIRLRKKMNQQIDAPG